MVQTEGDTEKSSINQRQFFPQNSDKALLLIVGVRLTNVQISNLAHGMLTASFSGESLSSSGQSRLRLQNVVCLTRYLKFN